MNKKNLLIVFIAIFAGIVFSMLIWQAKPLPWKYTFDYSYLPVGIVNFLDSPGSLRLIPVIVFIAFEAMFIYTIIAPVSALLVLVAIIPIMSIRFVSVHMNIYLHIIFLTAMLTAAISQWVIKGARHPFRLNCMDRWGALFLLYIWFSLSRTNSFRIGLKEVLSLTALFLTYFSVRFLIRNKKDIVKLSKWIAVIAGVVAFQAIAQFCLMKEGIVPLYEDRFYRIYTSFGDPTQLANFLIISIPIVGSLYFEKGKKIRWVLLAIIMIIALFLTFSRSAWIAICLALIVFILFKLKRLKKLVCVPVLIIMCIGFVFMSQDRYVVNDKLGPDVRIRSLYARRDILLSSLFSIKKAPFFGVGPGNFSYINTEYDRRDMVNTSVPNTYLHTLTISGIIGFCIMSLFLVLVLRTGQLYMKKGGYIFIGLYIGIVSNLMHACFENLFYNVISNWIFGLVLGLMITWQMQHQLIDVACPEQT